MSSTKTIVILAICGTAVLIAVITAITTVQIEGGDAGQLVRNLGLVATFLVVNIPILVSQLRTKERTEQIAQKTDQISRQVNGELQATVHNAVSSGVAEGVTHAAVDAANLLKEGQADNGSV